MSNQATDPEPGAGLAAGHTFRRYDRELTTLKEIILDMGQRAAEQLQAAVDALAEGNRTQAYRVLDREPQIDYLELDADEEVFRLIARRQPTAIDLRIVLALSRIGTDIERIGDEAVEIADYALMLSDDSPSAPAPIGSLKPLVTSLHGVASEMLKRSLEAVGQYDPSVALSVFDREPALGAAAGAIRDQIASLGDPGFEPRQIAVYLASVHALERAGNHASNIAEQVIYVAEGKDIRYRNRDILIETLKQARTRASD